MTMSMPPKAWAMPAMHCSTEAASVMSVLKTCAVPPAWVIAAATLLPLSASMSTIATLLPCAANSRAVSAPMPCAAPVISATRPLSSG
jgi:hypothetical protein